MTATKVVKGRELFGTLYEAHGRTGHVPPSQFQLKKGRGWDFELDV